MCWITFLHLCYIQSVFITPDYLLVPAVYCVNTVHLCHERYVKQWDTPVLSSHYKMFQNHLFWGTSIAATWEAFMVSKFVLGTAGKLEVLKWCGFMWHYAHTNFNKNPSLSLEERPAVTWWHHNVQYDIWTYKEYRQWADCSVTCNSEVYCKMMWKWNIQKYSLYNPTHALFTL